jgi:hypothetical protein
MREIYRGLFAPVALIGLIHIIGGTAVLFAPQAAYVSQLSGPMMLLPEPIAIAIGLIVVGVMAIAARLLKMSEQMRVALIAPQQILLTIQFKPIFADTDPRTVSLEEISAWRKVIEDTVSLREAHRSLKIWRALWKVCAALGYCVRDADPSLGVRNTAAKGRSATWTEGEVVRLFKRAWRDGYYGLGALIAVGWSTQLSPGDVRTLRASQLVRRPNGIAFFAERSKTGKPVGGQLNDRALAAMEAYLDRLGIELHADSYIFRTRSGTPYSKDTLGDDFRAVRSALFGEREKRTLADFRRSGAHEAIAGDATPAALAHAMGNTLSASNALFATYCPVSLSTIRSVMEARRRGRTKLRQNR